MNSDSHGLVPHDSDIPGSPDAADEQFEEICSEEVDRVVAALEELVAGVDSDNIAFLLSEAADRIHALIYEDEQEEIAHDEAA